MQRLPIEDNAGDVIGKAMRGLDLGDTALARRASVSPETVQAARKNRGDDATLRALAPHLRLGAEALVALAHQAWYPRPVAFADGFAIVTTDYDGMAVNSYLVWDPASRRAAAFDTGFSCAPLLAAAAAQKLKIELILLTHTHDDHIADLSKLRSSTGAAVWASEREPISGGRTFAEGHVFEFDAVKIETLSTWGHSRGGSTFVISGLTHPLAIVGDSLFASSMGGGMVSYEAAYRNNVEKILRLPDATVLACGHGPLTTVGEEKQHNPFFTAGA
jgi:hydroxyacylglutathione hydrolase